VSIVDERDLREQLGAVLDALAPSDPPVGGTVRKGKIIQAGRSVVIVTGLAVAAGMAVGAPALLHRPVHEVVSPARPTVVVEQACPAGPLPVTPRPGQPALAGTRAGEPPAARLAAQSCAWLKP
jgi:hypothetical protein